MKIQSSPFVRGLALLVFLLPSSAFAEFLTFYVDDPGNHLLDDQCFQIQKLGNEQMLLKFKKNLQHPDAEKECNEEETWLRTTTVLNWVDIDSPPIASNIKVFAPKDDTAHAKIEGIPHPFRLYVRLNADGSIANDVWISMPEEDDHPLSHIEGEGEHGGGAHGFR